MNKAFWKDALINDADIEMQGNKAESCAGFKPETKGN
jgi:hypothetical protein